MRVSGLWIYPIKSCRGIAVESARVGRRGFEGDRRHMIVDPDGRFITQREEPSLALVDVSLSASTIVLSAPEMEALSVARAPERGERTNVRVWDSECGAVVDADASGWFSRFLQRACKLVFMPDDVVRNVDPVRARPEDIVGFQDAYPFLMLSEASLADLETRASIPLGMTRFRPNLVITECAAFSEDMLGHFAIGDVRFENLKPCARCVVTTIDPLTARADKEPLATLATYRKTDDGVMFGVNLVHRSIGVVHVGDRLVLD